MKKGFAENVSRGMQGRLQSPLRISKEQMLLRDTPPKMFNIFAGTPTQLKKTGGFKGKGTSKEHMLLRGIASWMETIQGGTRLALVPPAKKFKETGGFKGALVPPLVCK